MLAIMNIELIVQLLVGFGSGVLGAFIGAYMQRYIYLHKRKKNVLVRCGFIGVP